VSRIVLASTSPYRRALLERLGLPFEAAAPEFAEAIAGPEPPPPEVARRFARGKAESLAGRYPDALVVGSDQTLELAGRRLSKPPDLAGAVEQLLELAGREHSLHTAVAVVEAATGRVEEAAARVDLRVRPLTRAQAERYVARDQPRGSVGGYAFEGLGVCLFEEVRGPDESAIVGLPLVALCGLLRRFGVDPLDAPREEARP